MNSQDSLPFSGQELVLSEYRSRSRIPMHEVFDPHRTKFPIAKKACDTLRMHEGIDCFRIVV